MANVPKKPPKRKVDAGRAPEVALREKRERALWTAMHDFVNGRPEHYSAACEACALTPPQASLLRTMDPKTPAPMTTLATALACHASNITGLVDRLEEQGLLERRPSQEDRRVKNICMTPKGVAVRERLFEMYFDAPPELGRLEEDDLAALERVMKALRPPA